MCNEDEEMAKWSEQKSDKLYNMVDLYEREATKASNQLNEMISSTDVGFGVPTN